MGTKVNKNAQMGMDDNIVSNSELLALLIERENLGNAGWKEQKKAYEDMDKRCKALILELRLTLPCRVGAYYIEKQEQKARHVEFDTSPSSNVKISKPEAKE